MWSQERRFPPPLWVVTFFCGGALSLSRLQTDPKHLARVDAILPETANKGANTVSAALTVGIGR